MRIANGQISSKLSLKIRTYNTLEKLREVFARFELPNTIVSDNGTPFTASEFSLFCSTNDLKHLNIPPGHPASNGAAENSVKSIKLELKKNMYAFPDYSPEAALSKYLLFYRNNQHPTTDYTPAELMLGRRVSLRFNKITSDKDIARQVKRYKGSVLKKFKIGDRVYVRDFSKPNKKGWKAFLVDEVFGNSMYICKDESSKMYY